MDAHGGRTRANSGTRWEPRVGYSRAVRAGGVIAVSGCVGLRADGTWPESAGEQTREALALALAAVTALGGRREDIIRTRMFVTDMYRFEEIGAAHAQVLGDVRPATSMVEVRRLVDDRAVVEIEVDAIVPD